MTPSSFTVIRIQWQLKSSSDYAKIRIMLKKCIGFGQFDQKVFFGLRDNSDYTEFTFFTH